MRLSLPVVASLREHRVRAGDRLADIAAEVGMTISAISQMERGQQHLTVEVLEVYHRRYRWGIRDAAR